ncbi:hypothetical protein ARZXY2_4906 (plasmid) [Arthrobacter sp. ZXY-2]|nr:hypothetical protein ARZXY2_4906 [Arthrobacter sp. ZXY-2]
MIAAWKVLNNEIGDKLIGLQILNGAGIRTPATYRLTTIPEEFPALGTDRVIFRPNLPTPFDADAVESASGAVDSMIVSQNEWPAHRSAIVKLVKTHDLLMQPYIEHEAGAIAHYWPQHSMMRLAIAQDVSSIANGEDAACEGILDFDNIVFITDTSALDTKSVALVAELLRLAPKLKLLPQLEAWEFELCIDLSGCVCFLQAQPSSTECPREWT